MYQPVRPKSAKGKTRPTRVINSTSNNNEASTSNSPSTRQHGHNTQGRSQPTMSSRRISTDASNEVHFPEITRPPSSLSKYRVLPGIPTTPDGGEGAFPANNDVDWLTEQAQQLLLDSALQRHAKPKSPPVPNKSPPVPTKRSAVANADVESKRKKVYQTQSIFTPAHQQVVKQSPKPRIPKEPTPSKERVLLALKLPDGMRVQRYFEPKNTIHQLLAFAQSQYSKLQMDLCDICRMDSVPKMVITDYSKTISELGIKHMTVLYIEEKEED